MNKYTCPDCKIMEVDEFLILCERCQHKQRLKRREQLINDTETIITNILKTEGMEDNKTAAYKLAIETLKFAKAQFKLSIGALIMDGAFESEEDSGAHMLNLYIIEYEDQIAYIQDTYLTK